MKNNSIIRKIFSIFTPLVIIFIILFYPSYIFSEDNPNHNFDNQPKIIKQILQKEDNIKDLKNLIIMLNQLDSVYNNLQKNLEEGKGLTVFVDPAHGKLPNGSWQGALTDRLSCSGLPEEYYSILISRELYSLLSKNSFINVKSTDDFLSVMKGKGDTYNNIAFSETVELAKKNDAFFLISEHLNNISSIHKASGLMNIPGIHITNNQWGGRYLTYIKNTHKGFLTLYNRFDTTGFSKGYANKLKQKLVAKGYRANNWQYGSVAEDRFSYFLDFPLSIIYETGFISNPDEEKILRDPEHLKSITKSQYEALIECIKDIFGYDLSGSSLKKVSTGRFSLTLLKLSRIAIYYIQNSKTESAIMTIGTMSQAYDKTAYKKYLLPYLDIRRRILNADNYYKKGKELVISKKYKNSKNKKNRNLYWKRYTSGIGMIKKSIKFLSYKTLLVPMKETFTERYYELIGKKKIIPKAADSNKTPNTPVQKQYVSNIVKSYTTKPIILAIEENQSLEEAIYKSLMPDTVLMKKLSSSFNNAFRYKDVRVRQYSKKKKRNFFYWKKEKIKINFREGIYIVRLDKDLHIKDAKRVNRVSLDPYKYQNQQYLKNSSFASIKKERSL